MFRSNAILGGFLLFFFVNPSLAEFSGCLWRQEVSTPPGMIQSQLNELVKNAIKDQSSQQPLIRGEEAYGLSGGLSGSWRGPKTPKPLSGLEANRKRPAIVFLVGSQMDLVVPSVSSNRSFEKGSFFQSKKDFRATYLAADLARVRKPDARIHVLPLDLKKVGELVDSLKEDPSLSHVLFVVNSHGVPLVGMEGNKPKQISPAELGEKLKPLSPLPVETALLTCNSQVAKGSDLPGTVFLPTAHDEKMTNYEYYALVRFLSMNNIPFPTHAQDFLTLWPAAKVVQKRSDMDCPKYPGLDQLEARRTHKDPEWQEILDSHREGLPDTFWKYIQEKGREEAERSRQQIIEKPSGS